VFLRRPFSIIFVAFMAVLAGCSRPPVVTIVNSSTVTLSNVVVSGSGFSNSVGNIAAGASHKLTVHPSGESDLRVVFDAGDRHIDTNDLAYLEASGGYRVSVTIQPDLKVSAIEEIRLF
jgi:hypothetical protein